MAEGKKKRSEASTSGGRLESVVIDVGRQKSNCGYCKSGSRTSVSNGLWAHSLTVHDYQALLDRGWRRSGCYLYKPDMEKSCCPPYTIRLKARDFIPTKEQTRVYRRMQRFLDGQIDVNKSDKSIDDLNTAEKSCTIAHNSDAMESSGVHREGKNQAEEFMCIVSEQIDNTLQRLRENGKLSYEIQFPKASLKKVAPSKKKLQARDSEELIFSCSIAFQISATLRRSNMHVEHGKISNSGLREDADLSELSPQKIANIFASDLKHLAESYGLSVRASNGHVNFFTAKKQRNSMETVKDKTSKFSGSTKGGSDKSLKKNSGGSESQRRTFEIRLNRSSFDYEEYSLYRKYQLIVHNDTPDHVTESSYRRFLVDTPLIFVPPDDNSAVPPCGFGSFHQQYVVDGKLIAVGVIDILPKCLSSKYLFWDPDFAFLSLGKYSALKEISWVRDTEGHCPSLEYYYLGYYIHSCSKMRYKAAYRPSELLCPHRYEWVPYDIAKPLLDRRKYVILSDFTHLQDGKSLPQIVLDDHIQEQHIDSTMEGSNDDFVDENMVELDSEDSDIASDSEDSETTIIFEDVDIANIMIGVKGARMRYKDIRHAFDPDQRNMLESQLQKYHRSVGTELSKQMVYSLG